MPQESSQDWAGRVATPFLEWYKLLQEAVPQRALRYTACAAFAAGAACAAAATYETTIGHKTHLYPTEAMRAADAQTGDRVQVEFSAAAASTIAGLSVLCMSIYINRPRES